MGLSDWVACSIDEAMCADESTEEEEEGEKKKKTQFDEFSEIISPSPNLTSSLHIDSRVLMGLYSSPLYRPLSVPWGM